MIFDLSVCIPSYNMGPYIGQTIGAVLAQLDDCCADRVEICISDNASDDNTWQIAASYMKNNKNISYFRWDKNVGADRNFIKAAEMAKGRYCWLLGADDLPAEGAIKKILAELKSGNDIYVFNRTECDIDAKPIQKRYFLNKNIQDGVFNLKNENDISLYLNGVNALGGVFSYISSIIFKKSKWDSVKNNPEFIGTAYYHAYVLFSIIKQGASLKYCRDSFVLCRLGNDSFAKEGFAKRINIDVSGYKKLLPVLFEDKEKASFFHKKIIKKEYTYIFLMGSIASAGLNEIPKILKIFRDEGIIYYELAVYSLYFPYKISRRLYRKLPKNILHFLKSKILRRQESVY